MLNPVMTTHNEQECGVSYTTSLVNPIGTIEVFLGDYIESTNNDSTGESINILFHKSLFNFY